MIAESRLYCKRKIFCLVLNFFSEVCLPAILYSTLFDVITAVSESYLKNMLIDVSAS